MEGHQSHGGEGAGRMHAVFTEAAVEQQHPARKCPRCNSESTKFCYYNNYSQSQPRYFCKGCRRYWTHGGSLRNVPAGGSSRRYKRPRPNAPPSTFPQPAPAQLIVPSTSQMLPPYSPAPHYFPGPFHGGGGAGFYSSLVALQSMNQAPLGTLASNLGNFFHGFDYATGLIDQKPCATSSGILPPFAGVGGAWNASGVAGGGGPQLAGDNSKPDFPSGGGPCAGGSHDN